ncbi:hypothetical protein METBIDRAFT_212073 [Metschnikowia bicuspidata var. bicuspidata NRRL YB-4993]|uniref:Uncharacterized protein n=1 Tax=Metschnikowia bicuspidata var. bicuspidata NRRL YB-4993 TaxID=869754 RepID=A0A1A0H7U5_9ASCO|nr:hypothetical protein METBIDRAFT_212073 [Metschnikowia bicuspidata var. bicuspidata NRRL YB-4993]OBA20055.1 hypothetical protein METBIDRAFT_212073 [Metschnikowia bicuspidata var. bicuspidata NRRL YB-4993]
MSLCQHCNKDRHQAQRIITLVWRWCSKGFELSRLLLFRFGEERLGCLKRKKIVQAVVKICLYEISCGIFLVLIGRNCCKCTYEWSCVAQLNNP